jgi:hypothetical protein
MREKGKHDVLVHKNLFRRQSKCHHRQKNPTYHKYLLFKNKFVHKTLVDTAQIKRKYKYSILHLFRVYIHTYRRHIVDKHFSIPSSPWSSLPIGWSGRLADLPAVQSGDLSAVKSSDRSISCSVSWSTPNGSSAVVACPRRLTPPRVHQAKCKKIL